MTQEEINEGNKLIAKFDGMQCDYNPEYFKMRSSQYIITKPEGLKYHTSWDWLMPVVKKINSMTPEIKMPEDLPSLRNNTHASSRYLSVCGHPICCPIELIYSEVVEFIKWHNSQSNP